MNFKNIMLTIVLFSTTMSHAADDFSQKSNTKRFLEQAEILVEWTYSQAKEAARQAYESVVDSFDNVEDDPRNTGGFEQTEGQEKKVDKEPVDKEQFQRNTIFIGTAQVYVSDYKKKIEQEGQDQVAKTLRWYRDELENLEGLSFVQDRARDFVIREIHTTIDKMGEPTF